MVPVISFVGRHNSGKTTLLTKIIDELNQQGIKTGLVKHAGQLLDISEKGDAEKLFEAGATQVYAASPKLSFTYRRYEKEPPLSEICTEMSKYIDLIITEGYKEENYPKIEVLRQEISMCPMYLAKTLALVSDFSIESKLPIFAFHQVEEICQFIIKKMEIVIAGRGIV